MQIVKSVNCESINIGEVLGESGYLYDALKKGARVVLWNPDSAPSGILTPFFAANVDREFSFPNGERVYAHEKFCVITARE
jgi:midasin (ATPase involved in ribosome maturation)